jgi:hypothetical protein
MRNVQHSERHQGYQRLSQEQIRSLEEDPITGKSTTEGCSGGERHSLGIVRRLQDTGLPIECGSGGLTKLNRTTRSLPKTHWLDAACVGKSTPEHIKTGGVVPLAITAYGHGRRQMCLMDKYGFPRTSPKKKGTHGFRTGDIVKAVVPSHLKHAGIHVGRMAAKASGSFTIVTGSGTLTDIGCRYCQKLQQADGYGYRFEKGEKRRFLPIP